MNLTELDNDRKYDLLQRVLSWTTGLFLAVTGFTLVNLVGRLEKLEDASLAHDRQLVRLEVMAELKREEAKP